MEHHRQRKRFSAIAAAVLRTITPRGAAGGGGSGSAGSPASAASRGGGSGSYSDLAPAGGGGRGLSEPLSRADVIGLTAAWCRGRSADDARGASAAVDHWAVAHCGAGAQLAHGDRVAYAAVVKAASHVFAAAPLAAAAPLPQCPRAQRLTPATPPPPFPRAAHGAERAGRPACMGAEAARGAGRLPRRRVERTLCVVHPTRTFLQCNWPPATIGEGVNKDTHNFSYP